MLDLENRINYTKKRINELQNELDQQCEIDGTYNKWTYFSWCDWLSILNKLKKENICKE
jgi:hypothetical protein